MNYHEENTSMQNKWKDCQQQLCRNGGKHLIVKTANPHDGFIMGNKAFAYPYT